MVKKKLKIDVGDRFDEAKEYRRDHPGGTLADFEHVFTPSYPKGAAPAPEDRDKPLSGFLFERVILKSAEDAVRVSSDADRTLSAEFDALWQAESAGPSCGDGVFAERVTDEDAVRTAYRREIRKVVRYLRNDLSVLIVCDKVVTEYIYKVVCDRANRKPVLDTAPRPEADERDGDAQSRAKQQRAILGRSDNPLADLPYHIQNLRGDEVLVLRSIDMLDNPATIELLYQRTGCGLKPQLLGFVDPSLEVKKVLTDRFSVHVHMTGLDRYLTDERGNQTETYTVSRLMSAAERSCFAGYDPEELFKSVAGLNPIQFRNAMRYVAAETGEPQPGRRITGMIREFKRSSSGEIDIPDTRFKDVGGYDSVKRQLIRTIRLIKGPPEAMDRRLWKRMIPRGFVFHGPPGTGKTLFAKAVANEMNATIQMISGPEIMDKYVGESENKLRRIFATARRNAPAVIFFDEFDSIASQRGGYSDGGTRANNAVVAQLLTELDGFREEQTVLVIGTTNRIDIIDEALLRPSRMRPIEINRPDHTARRRVAEIHAGDFGVKSLLRDLYQRASAAIEAGEPADGSLGFPRSLKDGLIEAHPPFRESFAAERDTVGFLKDLKQFYDFVGQCRGEAGDGGGELLAPVAERVERIGKRHGLDLDSEAPADEAEWTDRFEPMRADLTDLVQTVRDARSRGGQQSPDRFVEAIIDLVAEYTQGFNNDEIRAVFQEASMEHAMDGQLITPRYLGQKIGIIRKRRDEREAMHLSDTRGRH